VAATTGIELRTEVRLVGFGPCGGDSR
jgi:hypothetical protein